jgi:hypothetical protein
LEQRRKKMGRWRAAHPEINKERKRASYQRNKQTAICAVIRRRHKLESAIPRWLTADQKKQMAAKYREAAMASELTGTPHEVDHFVPLQGKNVCGLHVPWNLRILPQFMNREKSNKHAA